MKYIAIFFGMLGFFLLINVFFALLYLLSRSAGRGFYRWLTLNLDFLKTMASPFFGLTQWAASSLYERFNWFIARVLILLYAVFIFIIVILCFTMFGYLAGKA